MCHLDDEALPPYVALFCEDQARYVVTASPSRVDGLVREAEQAGLSATWIGTVGGAELTVEGAMSISVARLKDAHERWFPAYMDGRG